MKCKFSMNTSPKRRLARNELPYIYCACVHDDVRCAAAWSCKTRQITVVASHGATVCMVLRRLCYQGGTRQCGRRKPQCFGASVCMGATAPLLPRRNEAVWSSQATVPRCAWCYGAFATKAERGGAVVASHGNESYGNARHGSAKLRRAVQKGGAFQRKVTLPIPMFAKRLKYSRLE